MSTSILRSVRSLMHTKSETEGSGDGSHLQQEEHPVPHPRIGAIEHVTYPSATCDEALIGLVRNCDNEAIALLFRRYARLVRYVAYKILRDDFEADDLLQEIFILVHKKAGSFDPSKASVRFWILQMTYHRAITRRRYLKSRHFYAHVDLEDLEHQLPDPREDFGKLELLLDDGIKRAALQKLMATLSDNQQKTLRLYFFEGYTLDEIASELAQTRENVRHHYFRGLEKLRKQIFSKDTDEKLRKQIFCDQGGR